MYHPSVKEVETLPSELISEFQYYIGNSDYKDDEFDYLLEQSKALEHPPHESHVLRIALIGDAGQGKSSLLNSMLGQENLAIHVSHDHWLHLQSS
jgi:predicted GTPase